MNAPFPTGLDEEALELGALTDSVGFLLRMAQIRAFAQFYREFPDSDVRPGEFTAIWVLALNPGVRQGALARQLHIKPAHMTKLIQRLVKAGLVKRTVPPEDRRSVTLALTPAGHAYVDAHRARFLAVHAAERTGLDDAELDQLKGLLAKLTFKE